MTQDVFNFDEPSPKRQKFLDFHAANPHVAKSLRRMALELVAKGRKRYAIAGLFEVVRWHTALRTTDEDFKLNNNYKPFYARMLMEEDPALEGFFQLRYMNG